MNSYSLHPTLAQDTIALAKLDLCELLLMNERRYPWLVLVPQRANLTELYELSLSERTQLNGELDAASKVLSQEPSIGKINVGALGNLVSQLHLHVIGRHAADPAWPGPVWGHSAAVPYGAEEALRRGQRLSKRVQQQLGTPRR